MKAASAEALYEIAEGQLALTGRDGGNPPHVTDDSVTIDADRIDIARTIATLPEEQRVVVGLVLVEGWSYQEAAEMLETPIGTVMSRLSRARERIKAALDVDPVDGGAR